MKTIQILLLSSVISFSTFGAIIPPVNQGQLISAEVTNQLINQVNELRHSIFQLGDVKTSVLSEEKFQQLHGDCWVLMDGRSITGKDLASLTGENNIPDGRGVFFRGKNNGRNDGKGNPDGDLAIGTYAADAIRNISGPTGVHLTGGSYNLPAGYPFYWGGWSSVVFGGVSGNTQTTGIMFDASRQVPTAADNRPKNITMNFFIKVHNTCN